MTGDYSNQHLLPMKKVVEPQGEARNDFDVFADMSELLAPGGRDVHRSGRKWNGCTVSPAAPAQPARWSWSALWPQLKTKFWDDNQLIEMKWNEKNAWLNWCADFREQSP
ncbi:hypothetical protein OH492_19125 [Vibrio chagasii]|nr:hypothetical protein [Vibrio chagasii]